MSTPVTYAGNLYNIPAYQDTGYAQGTGNLSSYLIALATGSLTVSGGSFSLTADANFGASFGLVSTYFKSRTANIATAGILRLANTDLIEWRNNANDNNLILAMNATATGTATYTIPDVGASASFVMTEGTQIINGSKTFNSPILSSVGSVGAPGISFTGFTTTGIGEQNSGSMFFAVPTSKTFDWYINSNQTMEIASGQVFMPDGTQALPGISFLSDSNSGIWHIGSDNIGISVGNTKALDIKTTGVSILGTNTNDSAAGSYVGEYIESVVGATNAPTSGQFGDLTSISLTAGDWDVTNNVYWDVTSSTYTSLVVGISTTSGNSATGLVIGSNRSDMNHASSATTIIEYSQCVPAYRISLSGTTTVYFKYKATYTLGTPQAYGRLSARRVR